MMDEISKYKKLCTLCRLNNIENEIHILLHWPNYSSAGDDFYNKMDHRFLNLKELPLTELISNNTYWVDGLHWLRTLFILCVTFTFVYTILRFCNTVMIYSHGNKTSFHTQYWATERSGEVSKCYRVG